MRFITDFPSGNGKLMDAREREWGWEIDFLAESKAREPQPLWFYFRLEELTGEKVRLRLLNSAQCLGGRDEWQKNKPVARFHGGAWKRVNPPENGWTDSDRLETWFEIPLEGDSMEFAFCYPYPESQLMQTLAECPAFSVETIGYSLKQRPLRRIYNAHKGDTRPGIYVIGRQHASETTGAWEIDGMLRYLSSPEGKDALARFAWWFVPMIDIDGVEDGLYGKDQCFGDFNRSWHAHFPARIELVSVNIDLSRFARNAQPRLLMDMHAPGHSERDSYFVVHADTSDTFREELRAINGAMNAHLQSAGYQTIDFHEHTAGHNTSAQAGQTASFYAHARGINATVLECSYQGERNGRTYEISDYQALGKALVKAIAESVK